MVCFAGDLDEDVAVEGLDGRGDADDVCGLMLINMMREPASWAVVVYGSVSYVWSVVHYCMIDLFCE